MEPLSKRLAETTSTSRSGLTALLSSLASVPAHKTASGVIDGSFLLPEPLRVDSAGADEGQPRAESFSYDCWICHYHLENFISVADCGRRCLQHQLHGALTQPSIGFAAALNNLTAEPLEEKVEFSSGAVDIRSYNIGCSGDSNDTQGLLPFSPRLSPVVPMRTQQHFPGPAVEDEEANLTSLQTTKSLQSATSSLNFPGTAGDEQAARCHAEQTRQRISSWDQLEVPKVLKIPDSTSSLGQREEHEESEERGKAQCLRYSAEVEPSCDDVSREKAKTLRGPGSDMRAVKKNVSRPGASPGFTLHCNSIGTMTMTRQRTITVPTLADAQLLAAVPHVSGQRVVINCQDVGTFHSMENEHINVGVASTRT